MMTEHSNIQKQLININDSVLVVVDIQDSFLSKYESSISQPFLEKSVWFIEAAKSLNVPIIAMAEDIRNEGSLNYEICNALPDDTNIYDKNCFGLAGQHDIYEAVEATKRNTIILIGAETDVCVSQSALGLMNKGFNVVVLKDATITTSGDEAIGYNRMHDAGAVISSVKAVFYEWLRTVSNLDNLYEKNKYLKNIKPNSLVL